MQSSPRNNSSTILQILISVLGLLLALTAAAFSGIAGLAGVFGEIVPLSESVGVITTAWVAALMAALAVPSLLYSILRLTNRTLTGPGGIIEKFNAFEVDNLLGYRLSWVLLFVWPLVLALGSVVAKNERIAWLLLPPMTLFGIGVPVWWIIENARRRLPSGSPQRGWGILNFTVFLSTPLMMIIEVVGFAIVILLAILAISSNPEWLSQIRGLAGRLGAVQNDPNNLIIVMRPFLRNPLVVYAVLAVLSGMAPLIEELFKPLALWALINRDITPAGGFAAGALCGGAFALVESLLNLTGPLSDTWSALVVARAGTAVLHTTTTALVGWGLASAWKDNAYLRLGFSYMLAIFLHGLWNGLSVITAYSSVFESPEQMPRWMQSAAPAAPFALITLVIVNLLLLWGGNRILQKESQSGSGLAVMPVENAPTSS